MSILVIEPHYLGNIEYFTLLNQYDQVTLEVQDSFPKQTYRNRSYFLTSNKVQPVIVPVSYSNGMPTKEVKIDYSQRWVKDHWGAFYSAYGKAPFFEYFSEEFRKIWEKNFDYLVDLSFEFLQMSIKLLQIKVDVKLTANYEDSHDLDFRDTINPKKPFSDRKIYDSITYRQLFGNTFVPNLSITDLIMCEGPNAAQILKNSARRK
ncbi:WbqC family protein [Ekhidna sp.]